MTTRRLIKQCGDDPFNVFFKDFFMTDTHFSHLLDTKIKQPVDVYKLNDGTLRFEIACVGIEADDLDVDVEGDVLRVKYDKKIDDVEGYRIVSGISRKSFDQGWKLPDTYDLSKIKANLDKGLLSVTVPLSKDNKPRKIKVNVNNS